MRLPALEDYDAGNGLVTWALTVARMSHPSYDEYFAAEPVPPQRSASEAAADASAAHERYKAHRDRMVVEQAQAKARAEEIRQFKAEQARKRLEEERERKRVWAEGEAERVRMREIVREREAQWRLEQAEWDRLERESRESARREREAQWKREQAERAEQARLERERREAAQRERNAKIAELSVGAKNDDRLGRGYLVRIKGKNVNIGSSIRLEVGDLWEVGEYWYGTLISDGYAMDALD